MQKTVETTHLRRSEWTDQVLGYIGPTLMLVVEAVPMLMGAVYYLSMVDIRLHQAKHPRILSPVVDQH